jgi:hypothetical protein
MEIQSTGINGMSGFYDYSVTNRNYKNGNAFSEKSDAIVSIGSSVSQGFSDEDVMERIMGSMSKEVNERAAIDRASITEFKGRCRMMRKKILELTKKIREEEKESRKWGLLGKIFKWAAVVLGAIAAVATAVFTGGSSTIAYGIAIGAAVAAGAAGCASGGFSIASAVKQKNAMEGQVEMMKAKMRKDMTEEMKEEVLNHIDLLFEMESRVGVQVERMRESYDNIRKQIIDWR